MTSIEIARQALEISSQAIGLPLLGLLLWRVSRIEKRLGKDEDIRRQDVGRLHIRVDGLPCKLGTHRCVPLED